MSLNIDPKLALCEGDETFVDPIPRYLTRPNDYETKIPQFEFGNTEKCLQANVPRVRLDGTHQK